MAQFCGKCGTPLDAAGRCPQCGWSAAPEPAPQKKKKQKNLLLLIGIPLAVLAIILVLYLLGVFGPSRSDDGANEIPRETLIRPAAEEYLSELGTVAKKADAKGAALLTEAEAVRAFADRGFADVEITASYDKNGAYLGEQRVSENGSSRHPTYRAVYRTPDEVMWSLTLVGNAFCATPLSYNAEGYWRTPHVVSESARYLTYDGKANAFFTVEPDPDALFVKQVARIDAETLDNLSLWEVDES